MAWVDAARREMGRQGQELTSLRTECRTMVDIVRGEIGKLRADMDSQLAQIRGMVRENQRVMQAELQRLSA